MKLAFMQVFMRWNQYSTGQPNSVASDNGFWCLIEVNGNSIPARYPTFDELARQTSCVRKQIFVSKMPAIGDKCKLIGISSSAVDKIVFNSAQLRRRISGEGKLRVYSIRVFIVRLPYDLIHGWHHYVTSVS
jgi:hypothetical protein